MSQVVEGVSDFLGNVIDEVGEFGERLGFGENFGKLVAVVGIAYGGFMAGQAMGWWGATEASVAPAVAESGSAMAAEGAAAGSSAGTAAATEAAGSSIADSVLAEAAAGGDVLAADVAAGNAVSNAALSVESGVGGSSTMSAGNGLLYELPATATPEMMAADMAVAEGGMLSNPLVQYGMVQTGGQMLSGYAQGEAADQQRQDELDRYNSRGSYGVTNGGERSASAGTAGDRMAGITARLLAPQGSRDQQRGMLS